MTSEDIETLSKSLTFVFWFCVHALVAVWDSILAHPWTQILALRVLWAYSRMAVQMEMWFTKTSAATLPSTQQTTWTSVCTVDAQFQFTEVIYHNDTPLSSNDKLYDSIVLIKPAHQSLVSVRRHDSLQNMAGALEGDGTTRREPVLQTRREHGPTQSPVLQESRAHFLAITYHHPDLEDSIPVDVPQEMIVVDNEILSPAFVRRMFSRNVPFDNRYWLECVDDNIACTKLVAGQFLILTAEGYSVVSQN
jgi:hypothetical protein